MQGLEGVRGHSIFCVINFWSIRSRWPFTEVLRRPGSRAQRAAGCRGGLWSLRIVSVTFFCNSMCLSASSKPTRPNLHSPVWVGSNGGCPKRGGTNLGVFVPIWPVIAPACSWPGHIGTNTHPNLYPLAWDDRRTQTGLCKFGLVGLELAERHMELPFLMFVVTFLPIPFSLPPSAAGWKVPQGVLWDQDALPWRR